MTARVIHRYEARPYPERTVEWVPAGTQLLGAARGFVAALAVPQQAVQQHGAPVWRRRADIGG